MAILFRSQGYGRNKTDRQTTNRGVMIKHTHSWSKQETKTLRLKIPRSQIRFSEICELYRRGERVRKGGVKYASNMCDRFFFINLFFNFFSAEEWGNKKKRVCDDDGVLIILICGHKTKFGFIRKNSCRFHTGMDQAFFFFFLAFVAFSIAQVVA